MNHVTEQRPVRVGLISLGCAKNLVDSEIMLGSLLKEGVEITNEAAEADALIVNTCAFIDSAQEESVDVILESAQVREAANRGQALIVSGCMPQRFRTDLPKLLPEVDAFMGIDQIAEVGSVVREAIAIRARKIAFPAVGRRPFKRKIVVPTGLVTDRAVRHEHRSPATGIPVAEPDIASENGSFISVNVRPSYIPDFATPRFRLTPKHFAYVKIAEGCNHPCSFCIIPRMRGSHRSRRQADIIQEARQLIGDGAKELNLISQDSTYYGLDLRPQRSRAISSPEKFSAAARTLPADSTTLCTLLRELDSLNGEFWIRLLYTHPAHWTDELIQTIAECSKVARYVDMPLQHIHEGMLERMRRETSQQYIIDLIRRIRAAIPGIALRTTFIVGFPGETEGHFQTLLDFIRETRFERLGVFTYSQEEGTRAGKMSSQVPLKIRQQRRALAMAAQQEVARSVASSWVGRTIKVLAEKEATRGEIARASLISWEHGLIRNQSPPSLPSKGRYIVARSEADGPDIDGRVYVRGRIPVGEFSMVKVIGHTDYDLIAEHEP